MSPDAWSFATTTVATLGGLLFLALQNRKQGRALGELHERVEPTSNGFSKAVRESLARIEIQQELDVRERKAIAAHQAVLEDRINNHRHPPRRAA